MKMGREKTKLNDQVSIKLYRDGKLVEIRGSSTRKKSRLIRILEFLLDLFGD